jgi:hypothetical protein
VVGTEGEGTTLLRLCSKLYSDVSSEWRGENRVMLEVVDTVSRHTEKRGIWVLDRSGDRGVCSIPSSGTPYIPMFSAT